jgi:two-component system, chemotaxis family, protein-glutamate methylesterase/glutaminase
MAEGSRIRLLIVDDSDLVRGIVRELLSQDPDLVVAGEARDGREAVALTERLRPDLIIMDIQMPVMDGFAATEHIMAYTPTPILIFSSAIDRSEKYSSFRALSLGALDVMSKPDITNAGFQEIAAQLIAKIKLLSRIRVIPHIRGKLRPGQVWEVGKSEAEPVRPAAITPQARRLVAIGASTGGPLALEKLFAALPGTFPAGIVVVQHITRGFLDGFIDWLAGRVRLRVRVAADGETVRNGMIYFAPDDAQLLVSPDRRIRLRPDLPPWGEHKPAVNHLLQSVGESLGAQSVGVILTGMGDDGAAGMRAMHDRGAYTIAQDQGTSLIYGMPRAAVEAGGVSRVLPLERIAEELETLVRE